MLAGRSFDVALRSAALAIAAVGLVACAPQQGAVSPGAQAAPQSNGPLRVAVPRDSPPYAFWQQDRLVGMEVDFARQLAAALGRPLQLVEFDWADIAGALRGGQVDVIMGGMTITPAREVSMAFSEPYLRSGLLAMIRREDVGRYRTTDSALKTRGGIGVVGRTTGEAFVREHAPGADITVYPTALAAAIELRQRRVDVVVHDAPVAIAFVSSDEANLAPILKLLNEEQLGWAMRRDDEGLRGDVNAALARFRTDGTRDAILARWLPYWQRLEKTPAK